MSKLFEQIYRQKRYMDSKQAYVNMVNIASH